MSRTVRNRWWLKGQFKKGWEYLEHRDHNCRQPCCSQKARRKAWGDKTKNREAGMLHGDWDHDYRYHNSRHKGES